MKRFYSILIVGTLVASASVQPAGALSCFGSSIAQLGRNVAGNVTTFWPAYGLVGAAAAGLGAYGLYKHRQMTQEKAHYNDIPKSKTHLVDDVHTQLLALKELVQKNKKITNVVYFSTLPGFDKDWHHFIAQYKKHHYQFLKLINKPAEKLQSDAQKITAEYWATRYALLANINATLEQYDKSVKTIDNARWYRNASWIAGSYIAIPTLLTALTSRAYQYHQCAYHQ